MRIPSLVFFFVFVIFLRNLLQNLISRLSQIVERKAKHQLSYYAYKIHL